MAAFIHINGKPLQRKKVIWIFCLSATKDQILEDTVWNIEAGMEYLMEELAWGDPDDIAAILLVGELRLAGKKQSVPQMMLQYIRDNYPLVTFEMEDLFVLEEQSLTSRENIPMGLAALRKAGHDPQLYNHVLCSEKLHLGILSFLLYYWTARRAIRVPSEQTRLGWKGRLRRLLQQIDVRLDPTGRSPWYRWKHNQRSQYLQRQT